MLPNSDNDSYVIPDAGVPVAGTSTSKDSLVVPGGVPVQKVKKQLIFITVTRMAAVPVRPKI